jgi:polyribonucleotide nucleotidyltransferase
MSMVKFMIPQLFVESIDLGDGRSISPDRVILQSWICSSKNIKTVILGTVVSSRKVQYRLFTTVDYRENLLQQDVSLVSSKR